MRLKQFIFIFVIFIVIFIVFYVIYMLRIPTAFNYDSYDATAYAERKLDIDVLFVSCTGETGFDGSLTYDLHSDKNEICFILGENQNTEYVYSYGSWRNRKLIANEPSIPSTDVFKHFEDIGFDIQHWWYLYIEEIDKLVYMISSPVYTEIFVYSENGEIIYYTIKSESGFTKISLQQVIDLEAENNAKQ